MITIRKTLNHVKKMRRQKRGAGLVRGESVFGAPDAAGIANVIGREPTPEIAVAIADEVDHLLRRLGDNTLRRVAVMKLEGFSNEEIARSLDCAPRTVDRKLKIIRATLGASF